MEKLMASFCNLYENRLAHVCDNVYSVLYHFLDSLFTEYEVKAGIDSTNFVDKRIIFVSDV